MAAAPAPDLPLKLVTLTAEFDGHQAVLRCGEAAMDDPATFGAFAQWRLLPALMNLIGGEREH